MRCDNLKMIAVYTDTYHPAVDGVVNYVDGLVYSLSSRDIRTVIATVGHGRPTVERSKNTLTVRGRGITFPPYPQYMVCVSPLAVNRHVYRESPQVIHTQTPFVLGFMGMRAAARMGIPLISTFHSLVFDETVIRSYSPIGMRKFDRMIRWLKSYLQWYYSRCDVVVCPSFFVRDKLREIGVKNTEVIQNGLNLGRLNRSVTKDQARSKLGYLGDERIILFLGRVSKEKDLEVLIDSSVQPGMRDVKIIIAGSGPHVDYYRGYAARKGSKNIIFTGFVSHEEKNLLYSACDIFCNPSDYEVQSTVDIEALYMERPVLVPDRSSQVELVIPGQNGEVFRSSDPEDLAAKAAAMLGQLSSYSPGEGLEKYSLETHTSRILELYCRF